MTTPGGVPNLPQGALTLDNIASKTQDMSVSGMRGRADERVSSIFGSSTGGDVASDLSPLGIITKIFSGFSSVVANADPADIQGPEDLPGLLLDFIESLPVIGELVDLLEAILGTYTGDDETLLTVQAIFAPIRAIVDAIQTAIGGGDISDFFDLGGATTILGAIVAALEDIPGIGDLIALITGDGGTDDDLQTFFTNIRNFFTGIDFTSGSFDPITALSAFFSTIINTIFSAITGGGTPTDPLTDLATALQNIPFLNVLGVGGPGNIGESIQSTWDQLIGGLVGTLGSGAGLSDLFNIGQDVSSKATLGGFSWDILGIRGNNSLTSGFLPTSKSNISLDTLVLTPGTVGITQSTALTAYAVISESIDIGAISWQGSGVTSVTDCYVNLYKMDPATGNNGGALHASANIIGSLSGSMQQNIYLLPTPVHYDPGEILGVEICIRGAGTHSVIGAVSTLVDQAVFPRRWSSVRNSGTSAAPTTSWTPTYSNNVPFIEHAVSASIVPIPHSPQTLLFNTISTPTLPIPSWANVVQIVEVGNGGGGHEGGTYGISGVGGGAGVWNTTTWTRGTDWLATATPILTFAIPAAARGGDSSSGTVNGANGGSVTATLPATTGHSAVTLTATGGVGATAYFTGAGSVNNGVSPGNQVYDGITYGGAPAQATFGAAGGNPGTGGAGGNYVSFQSGGNGGLGAVWVRFKQ